MQLKPNKLNRLAVLIAASTFLLAIPSCDFLKSKFGPGREKAETVVVKPEEERVEGKDTVEQVPDEVRKEISAKKEFEEALTDSLMSLEETKPAVQQKGYYIVAGSYSSADNAAEVSAGFRDKKYPSVVIRSSDRSGSSKYLVTVRVFNEYEAASVFIREFRKTYPGAWIYESK